MKHVLAQAEALATAFGTECPERWLTDAASSARDCADALLDSGHFRSAERVVETFLGHESIAAGEWGPVFEGIRARAKFAKDDLQACLEVSTSALARYHGRPTRDLASLRTYRAAGLWRRNRVEEAIEALSDLRSDLLSMPDTKYHAACALHLSSALNMAGERIAARDMVNEALVSGRRCGSLFWTSLALSSLSSIERQACRWAASIEAAARAVAGFEVLGNRVQLMHARRSMAITLWKRGRNSEALTAIHAGLREEAACASPMQVSYVRMLEGLVHLHMGSLELARTALRRAQLDISDVPESRPNLLILEYVGDLELEQGRPQAALGIYQESLNHALATIPRGDIVAELRRRIAECHLLLGEPERAKCEARLAIELAREIVERYDEAASYRVLAVAHVQLGELEEAKKVFETAFGIYDEIETPYEWGKLWMSYGDWLAEEQSPRFGNRSHALEAYRAAFECFERAEARLRLEQARAKLESLNDRMRTENEPYVPSELRPRPARRPKVNAELVRRAQWALDTFGMVTRSEGILEMLEDVARVAVSDLPVLVLGESGTGKELVAQGVHRLSGRVGDFLAVNASAVPESMLESEFFGHMKGAFTNALADKVGLFEAAHEGTIFLDEIGEMSVDLQAKLLRYLETGVMRRVGGTRDVRANARVIAATNRSRESMQKGSGFRSDLYYRLAHAVYTLPPLRQRGDDVELLIDHYLAEFNRAAQRRVTLSGAARARLLEHGWPGNVRQLRAVIQKMVVSAPHDGPLTPREVPLEGGEAPASLNEELEAREIAGIEAALRESNGNKTKAAELLHLRRTSLITKMKRLGLMP